MTKKDKKIFRKKENKIVSLILSAVILGALLLSIIGYANSGWRIYAKAEYGVLRGFAEWIIADGYVWDERLSVWLPVGLWPAIGCILILMFFLWASKDERQKKRDKKIKEKIAAESNVKLNMLLEKLGIPKDKSTNDYLQHAPELCGTATSSTHFSFTTYDVLYAYYATYLSSAKAVELKKREEEVCVGSEVIKRENDVSVRRIFLKLALCFAIMFCLLSIPAGARLKRTLIVGTWTSRYTDSIQYVLDGDVAKDVDWDDRCSLTFLPENKLIIRIYVTGVVDDKSDDKEVVSEHSYHILSYNIIVIDSYTFKINTRRDAYGDIYGVVLYEPPFGGDPMDCEWSNRFWLTALNEN